jgi:uridine kinase
MSTNKPRSGVMNQQVKRIVRRIKSDSNSLQLVAVDGCGGAGKSTLTRELKVLLGFWQPVQIISLDHFYTPILPDQQVLMESQEARYHYFDSERFRQQVLLPLSMGHDIKYQSHDWLIDSPNGACQVKAHGLVIVDGVYSFSRCLRDFYNLSIYMDTPSVMRGQRLKARPQPSTEWIGHWQATEAWHHQYEQTALAADFVLFGLASKPQIDRSVAGVNGDETLY